MLVLTNFKMLTACILLCFLLNAKADYKTVVLVHGLNSDGEEFSTLKPRILQAHPNATVVELNYDPNFNSLDPIPKQMIWFRRELGKVFESIGDEEKIHLICHSQGGIVCLGYLTLTENHRVDTFIGLSSPIFGQYGMPKSVTDDVPILAYFRNLADELISLILYNSEFQNSLSIANYWRDPRPSMKEKYESTSIFLPIILNDPDYKFYNATEAAQRKKNLLELSHMVLAGGPDDEIIKPWQSPLFGYFDGDPRHGSIVNMTDQKIYTDDWIGLKTLDKESRLHPYEMAGIKHHGWVADEIVFEKIIVKWLT